MPIVYRMLFISIFFIHPLQALQKSKNIKHTIKNGETLFTVAKLYHSTSKDIQKENNMTKDEVLHIGQSIKVRTNTYFPKEEKVLTLKKGQRSLYSNAKLIRHTIKKNETFFIIARKYKTTIDEVLKENAITRKKSLSVGEVLIVPIDTYDRKSKKAKSYFVKHTIKKNETLFSIAKKYYSSVHDIKKKNALKRDEVLRLGGILIVPEYSYRSPPMVKKVLKKVKKKKIFVKKKKLNKKKRKVAKAKPKKKKIPKVVIYKKSPSTSKYRSQLISLAKTKLGRRYVWGASGKKNTYDCSSFTKYVYKRNGIALPRTSIKQSKVGKSIRKSQLKKGDLIFFDTSRRHKGYVNHVGIYLGKNKFIHASSAKKKVVISKLEKFYLERYRGARRP